MKLLALSPSKHGQFYAMVDDADYEWLNQWNWYVQKNDTTCYAVRWDHTSGKPKHIRMHRVILELTDSNIEGDHKDHNGLNNQRNNLRATTKTQNRYNSNNKSNSSCKFKGVRQTVRKCRGRVYKYWQGRIMKDGVSYNLGLFKSAEDAAKAYDAKAVSLFGEYANLNFK